MIGGSMDVSEHLRLSPAPCGHGSLELFGFHSYVRLSEIHRWHDASGCAQMDRLTIGPQVANGC
jgi:hypothetical protein